jgi:hypothetical protein
VGEINEFDAMKKALFGDSELAQEGFVCKVSHDLYGNGKKGLIDRVARLEWMLWPIYGGLAALIIMVAKILYTGKV